MAPSWSWASVNNTYVWYPDIGPEQKKPHLITLDYATAPANPQDPFGQVLDDFIQVRGKLGMAECAIPSESQEDVTHITLSVIDAMTAPDGAARAYEPRVFTLSNTRDTRAAAITLDVVEDNDHIREAYLLPVHTKMGSDGSKHELEALLLSRQPCGRYVRIGVAWLDADNEEEVLGSLLEHDITIIWKQPDSADG